MSKLTALAHAKTQLSPLAVGTKLTTEQLLGKDIWLTDADIVSYEEEKNGQPQTVTFAVCTVSNADKQKVGYYQGGKAITDIMVDVVADKDMLAELRKNGLHIVLTATKTNSGKNFTSVEVIDD